MDTPWGGFRLSAIGLGVSGLLTACGGGGGATTGPLIQGGSPTVPSATTALTTQWVNPDQVRLATRADGAVAGTVNVGVVDTGFLADHIELRPRVGGTAVLAGTATLADDVRPHGTRVAMVLGGVQTGHTAHARLLLAKVADSQGQASVDAVRQGAQWALNQGARVLNISLGPLYRHYGASTDALFGSAVAHDAVVAMSAGNDAASLSTLVTGYGSIFSPGYDSYRSVSLVVGALNGDQLASYSNAAGDNPLVQSRFLVAPGSNPVVPRDATTPVEQAAALQRFSGTSSATPVVAAAAASVRAYWPHMNAVQTAQLLLDTADRSFSPLYAQNHCGASGTGNCGYHSFGQGRLDVNRALQPVGATVLPTGAQVDGPSQPVATTQLVLPTAFGDALQGHSLRAALFDRYGRDFGFNLLQRVVVRPPAARAAALATADDDEPAPVGGRWALQLVRTRGELMGTAPVPLPLMSLRGTGPLSAYGPVHGLRLRWSGDRGANLQWQGTHARLRTSDTDDTTAQALRQELARSWPWGDGGEVVLGYVLQHERHALLGGTGSAGLGVQGALTHGPTLRARRALSPTLTVFGQAELGWLQARGNGLLQRVDGGRTSQWSLGLSWAQGQGRWGLVLSQPLRVEQARVQFDLPVGRELDGRVRREQRVLTLAPAGRQTDLELAYQQQPDARTRWSLHAIMSRDAGHVAGRRDGALLARYQRRW